MRLVHVHEVQSLLNRLAANQQVKSTDRISAALELAAGGRRRGSTDAAVLFRQVLRSDDARRSESAQNAGR